MLDLLFLIDMCVICTGSGSGNVFKRLGRWSYELAKRKLARARLGSGPVSSAIQILQVSSCCGNSQASLLLAAVYLGGLGVPEDTVKVELRLFPSP